MRAAGNTRTMSRADPRQTDSAWDRFVEEHPDGDLVQTTLWAATKARLGQQVHRSELRDADGAIVGGALALVRPLKGGMRLAYVPRGPLVGNGHAGPDQVVDRLVQDLQALRVALLIVQPPSAAEAWDPVLRDRGFVPGAPTVAPDATLRIDVRPPDDAVLAAMPSRGRRDVRRALREDIEVRQSDDVGTFAALHASTAARQGFIPRSVEYLQAQWDALAPGGHVAILAAYVGGRPVAAIWLTAFAGVLTYRLTGWDATASGGRCVNEALHWSAIRLARERGMHWYDLGGIDRRLAITTLAGTPDPAETGQSPASFKRKFAQTPLLFPQAYARVAGVPTAVARRILPSLLASPLTRPLADRFRNG